MRGFEIVIPSRPLAGSVLRRTSTSGVHLQADDFNAVLGSEVAVWVGAAHVWVGAAQLAGSPRRRISGQSASRPAG